jgi:hypothetical protein
MSRSSARRMNVTAPISGNPSERIDWITVLIECKTCRGRATLCIAEHQGCMRIFWRRLAATRHPVPSARPVSRRKTRPRPPGATRPRTR